MYTMNPVACALGGGVAGLWVVKLGKLAETLKAFQAEFEPATTDREPAAHQADRRV
jgi:hypothetical protein